MERIYYSLLGLDTNWNTSPAGNYNEQIFGLTFYP